MAREEIDRQGASAETLLKELGENNAIKTVEHRGQIQCVFLNTDENTCQAYECRPFECRLYPFLLIKKGDDPAVGVHLSCPYVQEKRQSDVFEDHIKGLQQYFQQHEVLEFLKRNVMLIGDYPKYEREIESLFMPALSNT